ncbi:hypothetical protein [Lactobacillus taiwanensis]|uniref:hypothetical protein n=1 Tax=Lactobacillus taiwanensis TaxID=508451 RepID=UPI0021C44FBF|nr:hypothetical protein [Lactobacillus taiwanensis]
MELLSDEGKDGVLTCQGSFRILLEMYDEKALKEDWEFGCASDYMPVSDKYREWLQDPILHDIRRVADIVGFIYA